MGVLSLLHKWLLLLYNVLFNLENFAILYTRYILCIGGFENACSN